MERIKTLSAPTAQDARIFKELYYVCKKNNIVTINSSFSFDPMVLFTFAAKLWTLEYLIGCDIIDRMEEIVAQSYTDARLRIGKLPVSELIYDKVSKRIVAKDGLLPQYGSQDKPQLSEHPQIQMNKIVDTILESGYYPHSTIFIGFVWNCTREGHEFWSAKTCQMRDTFDSVTSCHPSRQLSALLNEALNNFHYIKRRYVKDVNKNI